MSFVALVTDDFESVAGFYGEVLGFPMLREWDRPNGRGCVFDAFGMGLEVLDNRREAEPLVLLPPGARINLVIEVPDMNEARAGLGIETPEPQEVSWGARLFEVRDPDGVSVTFLEWRDRGDSSDGDT